MKKSGLGKGLGAMIPKTSIIDFDIPTINDVYMQIDINKIEPNPNQPRKNFPKEELDELCQSIKEHGIIQPITVNILGQGSEESPRYTIIAGERRWRASRMAGLTTLPCIVKTYDDMQALQISLIENIQRQDLNPIEEALCYKQLEEYFFHTKEDIAKKVGKSRNTISSRMSLLALCPFVIEALISDEISPSHGQKLLGLPHDRQEEIAELIIEKNLSVKETEQLAKKQKEPSQPTKNKYNPYINLETGLKERLGTKVAIKDRDGRGKIEIEYYSNEDLERIMEILN